MTRKNDIEVEAQASEPVASDRSPGRDENIERLIDAFRQLSRGAPDVRLARNHENNDWDRLADSFNTMAEELGRILTANDADHLRLEQGVADLNEMFLRVAVGDFTVRSNRTGSGDPFDVLSFLFDCTVEQIERSFAEEKKNQATLNAIFDSLHDALFFLDRDGRIEKANLAASELLGRPIDVLEGMNISDLLDSREQKFAETLKSGGRRLRGRDTFFLGGDGEQLFLVLSGAPVSAEQEQLGAMILTLRDERELRDAQAQLQLSDRMATMGTLAAGVAHEINNPMSFVLSNLEFALEELEELGPGSTLPDELYQELLRALETSKTGSERVAQIVRDLKLISRADEGTKSQVDVRRVIDTAASMLKNDIRHRALLVKDYDEVPLISANEARLLQVALNLIQNAAQAIEPGQANQNQISLQVKHEDGRVVITISDTGVGIAPDRLDEVFKSFYTSKNQGTGLGLSISSRLVTQMHGTITVASELGRGSTFCVRLPALVDKSSALPAAKASTYPKTQRRRVLVVDDEPEIGESVRRLLGANHHVDIALDGTEALQRCAEEEYDVILIDLLMPHMPGREVRNRIRASFPNSSANIVFMSGSTAEDQEKDSGDALIEKPFSPEDLRGLIANGPTAALRS